MNKLKNSLVVNNCFIIFITLCFFSCKRKDDEGLPSNISPTTGTRTELTLDSIFLYAKEIYYWQDALPDYGTFDPRKRYAGISPELSAFQKEIYDITQYKLNPSGFPYEKTTSGEYPRYSYISKKNNSSTSAAFAPTRAQSFSQQENSPIDMDKVGYLNIDIFNDLTEMKSIFDKTFEGYTKDGIETLIIDLRKNRGGSVETVEYLANLIAPSSFNGKVMFSELYNPILRSGKARILQNQPYLDENGKPVKIKGRLATLADIDFSESGNITKFSKLGKFETVRKLYFMVSGQTASASELLISCFKPHIPIRIIGQKTYGKPVGFFPISIDQYSVFMPSFLLLNADGWSDYFDGIPPDININGGTALFLEAILSDINPDSKKQSKIYALKTASKVDLDSPINDQHTIDRDFPITKKHYKFKSENNGLN
ncbi:MULTISPECIES: S41 family peptidase [Bacteroidota]|uniref:S41 family peptidase n=1 Tax=Bacteroidota TaxID=976 RepID=UPI002FD9EEDE